MSTTAETPPTRIVDGAFLAPATALFFFFFAFGMVLPVLPIYITDSLGGSDLAVGIVVGITAVSAVAIRPWIPAGIQRWGAARLIAACGILGAISFIFSGLIGSTAGLSGLRLIAGVSQAVIMVAALIIVSSSVSDTQQGQVVSYLSVAPYMGIGLGPVVSQPILENYGATWAFAAAGVVSLVATAAISPSAIRRPERDMHAPRTKPEIYLPALVPGVVLMLGILGPVALSTFMPLYIGDLGSNSPQWIFLGYSAVILAARILGGRIPDRLGAMTTGVSSTLLISAGLTGIAIAPSVAVVYLALVPFGIGIALQYPGLLALVISRAPDEHRSAAISTFTMFFDIASGLGAVLIGVAAMIAGYRVAFAVCAAAALLGLILLFLYASATEHHSEPRSEAAVHPGPDSDNS